jgi:hypothetical protein
VEIDAATDCPINRHKFEQILRLGIARMCTIGSFKEFERSRRVALCDRPFGSTQPPAGVSPGMYLRLG